MSSDGFVLGWSVERVSLSVFIVEILDFTSHFFYILFSLFVTFPTRMYNWRVQYWPIALMQNIRDKFKNK